MRAKSLPLFLTLCDHMDCFHQAPLSMRYSWQEYWSVLLCPPPGDLFDPMIKSASPAAHIAGEFFTAEPPGKPQTY